MRLADISTTLDMSATGIRRQGVPRAECPGERTDRALSLTPVPRGGNVVLIRPVDRGVFDGVFERDGLSLASRPQLYVDLVRRGGAAAEAAAFIRERSVLWQP